MFYCELLTDKSKKRRSEYVARTNIVNNFDVIKNMKILNGSMFYINIFRLKTQHLGLESDPPPPKKKKKKDQI